MGDWQVWELGTGDSTRTRSMGLSRTTATGRPPCLLCVSIRAPQTALLSSFDARIGFRLPPSPALYVHRILYRSWQASITSLDTTVFRLAAPQIKDW